jgi:cytochrome c peroxidase
MSKNLGRWTILVAVTTLLVGLLIAGQGLAQTGPTAALGEKLYFDTTLSDPDGQACASCHEPAFGFVDPDNGIPVSEGVNTGLFGTRNSPMSAYAMYAPIFHFDGELWIGGQFWDGRAKGGTWPDQLHDPLAEQARGPFLNPVEMANTSKAQVIAEVLAGEYGGEFAAACGTDEVWAYDCLAKSIGLFERTPLFGQFSSKYDAYLEACIAAGATLDDCAKGIGNTAQKVGKKMFSREEWTGFQLFMNENNNNDGILDKGEGAMCVACHVADWTVAEDYDPDGPLTVVVPAWAPAGMVPPVFTDFSYDNLGVPINPEIEELIGSPPPIDLGLGPIVEDDAENGKFKVMTLRNIGLTEPYAHNGFFKRLKDITKFYNTRDVMPKCDMINNPKPGKNCWPDPEVPETINVEELGSLGLSDADEDALVEFMKTLSDGWKP